MTESRLFPMLTSGSASAECYMAAVAKIPLLSAEEEQSLATQLADGNNVNAAKKLILSHLRFVAHIARGYQGYGLPLADVIQEGNIGLMKAVKRFNVDAGVRLSSFAVHWIKSEIHEYVLRNWGVVRIATTKAQRKLFFNLRRAQKAGKWFSADEVTEIAARLSVPEFEVREMESRMSGRDLPYDNADDDHDDNDMLAPAIYLHDHTSNVAELHFASRQEEDDQYHLTLALSDLDDRSRDILKSRIMDDNKTTLYELADRYSVSAERIRQLEKQALGKLKNQLIAA